MSDILIGDEVLILKTGKVDVVIAINKANQYRDERYHLSNGGIYFREEIEEYIDMPKEFDDMIDIVLTHKQVKRAIDVCLEKQTFKTNPDYINELVERKNKLEKEYLDLVKNNK